MIRHCRVPVYVLISQIARLRGLRTLTSLYCTSMRASSSDTGDLGIFLDSLDCTAFFGTRLRTAVRITILIDGGQSINAQTWDRVVDLVANTPSRNILSLDFALATAKGCTSLNTQATLVCELYELLSKTCTRLPPHVTWTFTPADMCDQGFLVECEDSVKGALMCTKNTQTTSTTVCAGNLDDRLRKQPKSA